MYGPRSEEKTSIFRSIFIMIILRWFYSWLLGLVCECSRENLCRCRSYFVSKTSRWCFRWLGIFPDDERYPATKSENWVRFLLEVGQRRAKSEHKVSHRSAQSVFLRALRPARTGLHPARFTRALPEFKKKINCKKKKKLIAKKKLIEKKIY